MYNRNMFPRDFTFVDIETTGLSPKNDRIIEIGILCVKNEKVINVYETLINPKIRLPSFISQITGISQKSLWSAPTFREVINDVHSLLKESVFVAHNVLFDYRFLQLEFEKYGYELVNPYFCTARLSRSLYPQYKRHNLDSIIQRFCITCESRHRALSDARVLWDFFQILQKNIGKRKLHKAILPQLKSNYTRSSL